MADLIIRGMEMPKTCCQCDFKIYDNEMRWDENGIEQIGAWVCKRTREIIWNTQRGENCPLVPIPEGHGRLGDLDAIVKRLEEMEADFEKKEFHQGACWFHVIEELLKKAPTVVPSEGGEADGSKL